MADIQKFPLNSALPRWAYFFLAALCAAMGLWASYITLEYFEHGAKALETDKALQALAVSAALMFVASEMAAFALAALLTERQLKARRWSLTGFACAVLALEVCTIVAVQLALTVGADMTQGTVQTQEKDLRARITALEAGAAAKRADAALQRAAGQLTKAAGSGDRATAEQAKTAALYDELAKVQGQKRPTLSGLLGEKYAIAYAVARGILVSLGGLVFFGVAGALLRAARGGAQSVDAQLLALLHELRGTPVHMAMQAQAVAPAGQVPALVSFKPVGTVAPSSAPVGVSYSSKAMMAGAGLLAATAAPVAHSAPAVPAQPAHPTPAGATEAAATVPTQAHPGVPTQAQPDTLKSLKKRAATAVPDGSKIDTGTTGNAAMRYGRVKAAVKAGKLKPTVRAIQAKEGGGGLVVRRYLQQLEADGVITRKGRGYSVTVTKGDPA